MSDIGRFAWVVNKVLDLPFALQIRILQREVPDPATFRADLLPFEETPAIWRYWNGQITRTITGTLATVISEGATELFLVEPYSDGLREQLRVSSVNRRELTVWRVNEQLDMLQVRVEGEPEHLYGQLGGERSLEILSRFGGKDSEDPAIVEADQIYRTGKVMS